MLSLHKNRNKKILLSILITSGFVVSASVFVANKFVMSEFTYADGEENYTMPAGFNDQNFYNCVVRRFKAEFGDEEIPEDGLADGQLAKIAKLDCSRSLGAEKIVDVSGIEKLTGLTSITLSNHAIEEINLSNNVNLVSLNLNENNLNDINLGDNTELVELRLSENNLSNIDITNNVKLEKIDLGDNDLDSVNVSSNLLLKSLDVEDNNLSYIDVSANTVLEELYVNGNEFETIDVSSYASLKKLDVSHNNLTTLDLTGNPNLQRLWALYNKLVDIQFPINSQLEIINLYNNKLPTVDMDNLTKLKGANLSANKITDISLDKNTELIMILFGWGDGCDHSCAGGGSFGSGNLLTSIDVSKNTKLKYLNVGNNRIEGAIDTSHNMDLVELVADNNAIDHLDFSANDKLETLIIDNNRLESLDLSNNLLLETLVITGNNIASIDLTRNTMLYTLLVDEDTLVDVGLAPMNEGEYDYDLSGLKFIKDDERSIMATNTMSGGAGGYTLGDDVTFTIDDVENYAFDKEGGILTVINPDTIDGSVIVTGNRVFDDRPQTPIKIKLKLFELNGEPEEENIEDDEEEEVAVPDTSAPETGENGMNLSGGVLVSIVCGWSVFLGIAIALVILVVRCQRRKHFKADIL